MRAAATPINANTKTASFVIGFNYSCQIQSLISGAPQHLIDKCGDDRQRILADLQPDTR
jgi:hypothetical protein